MASFDHDLLDWLARGMRVGGVQIHRLDPFPEDHPLEALRADLALLDAEVTERVREIATRHGVSFLAGSLTVGGSTLTSVSQRTGTS